MKGDFSRTTFDRQHHFARVLMQQGRVLLDADWNEQTSILLHYLRSLAADLIGPHGGPSRGPYGDGFRIHCDDEDGNPFQCDFAIGWGHYYVDGILCENVPPASCPPGDAATPLTYNNQQDYPLEDDEDDAAKLETNTAYLVYLDVWERHLTHLEVDHLREVALGGPDTATRARIVWQVRVAQEPKDTPDDATCRDLFDRLVGDGVRCLRARARVDTPSDDPCIIPPEARYRGAENQLYRVEIHDGGTGEADKNVATFKWSRDNGAVVFGIRSLQGETATLDTLGPDARRSLQEGDWVEVVDDYSVLRFAPRPLVRVKAIDRVDFEVTLAEGADDDDALMHPLLRRWDQGSAPIPVEEGTWIDLEDGVQVYFEPGGTYRTGDYWLIPARTATGDVLWPADTHDDGTTSPRALPPHGIEHHYAPLARITLDGNGNVTCVADCRCTFDPLCAAVAAPAAVGPAPSSRPRPIAFAAGTTSLSQEGREVARQNAALLRRRLEADARLHVAVVGHAGPGEEEHAAELSMKRANRVRTFYVEAGLPAGRVTVHGADIGDASSLPPAARRRVETRLTTSSASAASREEKLAVLRRIDNVGKSRAETLLEAGRATPGAVAAMTVGDVRTLLNVGEDDAQAIIESARTIAQG